MGVVGREMMATLERRKFPVAEFRPLDISAHEGKTVEFGGKTCTIKTANFENFKDIDIAIFSAGGDASLALTPPKAVKQGAIVIDNSSVWRMDPPTVLWLFQKLIQKTLTGIMASSPTRTVNHSDGRRSEASS